MPENNDQCMFTQNLNQYWKTRSNSKALENLNSRFTWIEHYNQEQAFISDQDYLREAMLVVLNFQLLPSVVKMDNKGKFCRFSKSGGCSKSIDFTDFSLSQIFKCYFEPVWKWNGRKKIHVVLEKEGVVYDGI